MTTKHARKFRVYARKLQTPTEHCFTRTMDATFTKFHHGMTTRKPNAEHNGETPPTMTQNPSLTNAYTVNKRFQSVCKEVQSLCKETTRREQGKGNRGKGTGEHIYRTLPNKKPSPPSTQNPRLTPRIDLTNSGQPTQNEQDRTLRNRHVRNSIKSSKKLTPKN